MLYIDGKGIGWATNEPNFMEIHSRISLQTLCKDKCMTEKLKGTIFSSYSTLRRRNLKQYNLANSAWIITILASMDLLKSGVLEKKYLFCKNMSYIP